MKNIEEVVKFLQENLDEETIEFVESVDFYPGDSGNYNDTFEQGCDYGKADFIKELDFIGE